jgi:ATP synthase protein I
MATDDGQDERGASSGSPRDVELSGRLQRLEQRLAQAQSADPKRPAADQTSSTEPSAMGKAFRLSTEFMAGIIAGAGLGYALDTYAGTRPWGMIILLMLGFGAGVWNVMRASGFVKPPSRPGPGG